MTDIVLLDGGMGQELIARAGVPPAPMWSAQVMLDQPELVEQVHRDFIAAGATAHILNTYCVTPQRLARDGAGADTDALFTRLHIEAIARAQAAGTGADVTFTGCLPPLAGSYHAVAAPDEAEMARTYARLVAAQRAVGDLMIAETMSSVREARVAAQAIVDAGCRAWIALSVDDRDGTLLRSGEALSDGINACVAAGAQAVLLNCSRPEAISQGIGILAASGLPFGAYANGFIDAAALPIGGTVAGLAPRVDLGPQAYADIAMDWIARGATIVGGCCEVGPAHIAELARRITAQGYWIVRP